jgi:hypothetical protein
MVTNTIWVYEGYLTADLGDEEMVRGCFKTAHPGLVKLDKEVPPFTTNNKV